MENYPYFQISEPVMRLADQASSRAAGQFEKIQATQRWNQQKMLAAFQKAGVSESGFTASTGYGYGDRGHSLCWQMRLAAMTV